MGHLPTPWENTQRGEHEEIPHLSPGSTTNNDNNAQLGIATSNALQCVYYMIHIYIYILYQYVYIYIYQYIYI